MAGDPSAPRRTPTYPFEPRSNRYLSPGQFWGIELADGLFACGRVLDIDPKSRVEFLAGLMDWCGDSPPTSDAIAGTSLVELGTAHVKTIVHTGRMLLGCRPLKADELTVPEMLTAGRGGLVVRGYTVVRRPTLADEAYLTALTTWGYNVIRLRAVKRCAH